MSRAISHFLDLDQLDRTTLRAILDMGLAYKQGTRQDKPMAGRTLAMIFEKPSTRTRVSFEVAADQLGGASVILDETASQMGRGETLADTARVLSRYVDVIMIRTDDPAKKLELARHAEVPVINGLTDESHPCQVMADIMTYEEHRGGIAGARIAWLGDGNNMATSWIQAAARFDFSLHLACPDGLAPAPKVVAWARSEGARISLHTDPRLAATDAACVVTDTWISMGNQDADNRRALLAPYQVNEALMARARADALFMHCLPAHRGEEVTDDVIDGPWSVVWDEAENRLHVQKGILAWCLS